MKSYIYNLATDKSRGFFTGIIKLFLFILSFVYGLVVRILILIFHLFRYSPDCKVIGVGNITLGGTGKTALVEFLARFLKGQGKSIAIISRGYKRKAKVSALSTMDYDFLGDEPYMLSKKLKGIPVIVEAQRIKGIKKAIKDYAVDTVILDDAFQQWGIRKDMEVVTIDAANPFGNKFMIPRGILREPISSLKRADIFILTKTNLSANTASLKDALRNLNRRALILESEHRPLAFYDIFRPEDLFAIGSLKGKTAVLFSGIGDPGSFEKLILSLGIKIGLSFRFPDHHHYSLKDLQKIIQSSQGKSIDTIITTEKDAARICDLQFATCSLRLLALRIELSVRDEQRFNDRLLKLYPL
ncbi:MAG: tetraacyldisaccharide 4'-kinase [Candidatus Omnitrophota bacterium]